MYTCPIVHSNVPLFTLRVVHTCTYVYKYVYVYHSIRLYDIMYKALLDSLINIIATKIGWKLLQQYIANLVVCVDHCVQQISDKSTNT